jgi:hypothetical protein
VTEEEWLPLAARIGAAWPSAPMDELRRDVFFQVLSDLEAGDVAASVNALLREDRESQPPPGVIRARAIELRNSQTTFATPEILTPPAPPELPPPPAPTLMIPGLQAADTDEGGPFNHRAFWGLIVGLLAVLGPLSIRAAIRTADPESNPSYFPIEASVLAVIALCLSISARNWADENGGGRTLSLVALVVAVLACVFALGAFGATVDNSDGAR